MPTVLDQLSFELGLDPSQFEEGLKKAVQASLKLHDETIKHSKEIQHEVGENLTEAFRKARDHIIEFTAALLGARTVVDFTADTVSAGSAMSTLSTQLGMAPEKISAFQMAMERVTGSTQGATAALVAVNGAVERSKVFGETPGPYLVFDKDADALENILKTVENLNHGTGEGTGDIQDRVAKLQSVVQDAGVATQLITLGAARVREMMKDAGPNVWTQKQVDDANKLLDSWVQLKGAATSFARSILGDVEPALSALLLDLKSLFDANREGIKDWVGDKIKAIDEWIKTPGWQKVADDFEEHLRQINAIVKAIGGWQTAIEALAALFIADKIANVVLGLIAIARALALISGVSALSAVFGGGVAATAAKGAGGAGLMSMIWQGIKNGSIAVGGLAALAAGSLVYGDISGQQGFMKKFYANEPMTPKEEADLHTWIDAQIGAKIGGNSGPHPRNAEVAITADGRPVTTSSPLPVISVSPTDSLGIIPFQSGSSSSGSDSSSDSSPITVVKDAAHSVVNAAKNFGNWLIGGDKAKASTGPASSRPAFPVSPSGPHPRNQPASTTGAGFTYETRPEATPLPPGAAPRSDSNTVEYHGKHYHQNADGTLGAEVHAWMQSSTRYASEMHAHAGDRSKSVSIAALHINGSSNSEKTSDRDVVLRAIKRDLLTLNMDVGLA